MADFDLYFECSSGISGDMAVAALLDAGADKELLLKVLDSIPAGGFKVQISRVSKGGIAACEFSVILEHDNHDHDMEYLFGHEGRTEVSVHGHGKEGCGHDESGHHHEEASCENHEENHHHHEHRNLKDVLEIVDGTQMTASAKKLCHKIFGIIAEAEGEAHGIPPEQVHFHEVGALDSIVDVIAFATCLDSLKPRRVFIPFLTEGTGTIRCQHGILPVPVPAVSSIARKYGLPLRIVSDEGEFVTPTGAAFAAAVCTDFSLPKAFTIQKIGLGAGKRSYRRTNLLRAMLIKQDENDGHGAYGDRNPFPGERLFKLETDIDDCTGEALGFVLDQLFEAGARDVHYLPCFMKKNRPAYQLCVICTEESLAKMEGIIFTHTTTIGIRRIPLERTALARKELELQTDLGRARLKEVLLPDGSRKLYPEYESVAEIARASKKSFDEVYMHLAAFAKKP